jgi:hypothetical protein
LQTHLPVKTALLKPFASILPGRPFRVGRVEYTVAALLPLANGLKIIDFPRQSSFAIPSWVHYVFGFKAPVPPQASATVKTPVPAIAIASSVLLENPDPRSCPAV